MFHSLRKLLGNKPNSTKKARKAPRRTFRPMVDALEDRRLLAVLFVDDNLQQFPTAQFTTIQAAVNAAAPGDTIAVFAGKYNENVTIPANKPRLTINGTFAGPTLATNPQIAAIVDPPAVGNKIGFNVLANDTVIRGFTVGDIDDNTPDALGIFTAATTSGWQISNNVIQDSEIGVYPGASGAKTSYLTSNWIRDNNDNGPSGNGIYADQGSKNIHIVSNIITDQNNAAILFTGVTPAANSGLRIENNVIGDASRPDSGAQILLVNTVASTLNYNAIYNSNYHAIALGGGVNTTSVSGNAIIRPTASAINVNAVFGAAQFGLQILGNSIDTAGDSGIRLRAGTFNSVVAGNSIVGTTGLNTVGTGNGISIENSSNNQVFSNFVAYSANNGILVTGASAANSILSNVSLFNGDGITTFDLNEQGILFANFWLGNTAQTRSRPGL